MSGSSTVIKVGLVGCGRMGEVHLQILKELQGVQIVGVADPDPDRAISLAAKGGIGQVSANLESLLELVRPDVIHVLTPPASHVSLVCTALRAGCHVFVEKPMALTAYDAGLMVTAAEQGCLLVVGHNHLFDPVIGEALTYIAQGRLGRLVGLDGFHGELPGGPDWLFDLPSGSWMDDAPHLLYLSQLFMGDPSAIRAIGYPTSERSKFKEVRVVAHHPGGLSSLTFSEATIPYRHRLTLYGTKRTLEVDLIVGTLVECRPFSGHRWLTKGMATLDVTSQLLLGAGRNAVRVLMGRERGWPGLRELLGAFYSAIRRGGPSPVPAVQGVRVAELMDEIGRCIKGSPDGSNG